MTTTPDLNFGDLFDAIAPAFPDRVAMVFGDLERTWGEMDERANRLARALAAAGLADHYQVGQGLEQQA